MKRKKKVPPLRKPPMQRDVALLVHLRRVWEALAEPWVPGRGAEQLLELVLVEGAVVVLVPRQ